jgi:hypothetical protein
MSDPRTALAVLARRQHGAFSRHQALALGLTRHQLDDSARTRRVERIGPGVYRMAGAPSTWEQRLLAAVLAAGPGALATHRSAAVLWGLDGARPGVVEISVPRHRRPRRRVGVRGARVDRPGAGRPGPALRHPGDRPGQDADRPRRRGPAGAAGPGGRRRDPAAADGLAPARRRPGPDARRGRNGTGRMRELLEERYGTTIPDSHFGRLVADLLVDAGLPAPEIEYDIRALDGRWLARADLAYPPERVAVELDSKRHHLNERAFEADPIRQNRVEIAGWTVLRYRWKAYSQRPQVLCTDVSNALLVARLAAAG